MLAWENLHRAVLYTLSDLFHMCVAASCRDLKPENLIMTSDDNNADLKIVDFGFAAIDTGGNDTH
jgi:hypothetical protein